MIQDVLNIQIHIMGSAHVIACTGLYASFPSVSGCSLQTAAGWQIGHPQIWQSSEVLQRKKTQYLVNTLYKKLSEIFVLFFWNRVSHPIHFSGGGLNSKMPDF